eukprot:253001-Pleurochrysis_carterae.AAC.2
MLITTAGEKFAVGGRDEKPLRAIEMRPQLLMSTPTGTRFFSLFPPNSRSGRLLLALVGAIVIVIAGDDGGAADGGGAQDAHQ